MTSELMTAGDVAKLLGNVTPATVRNWGDKRVLPMQRTRSGVRLFRRADVEALRQVRKDGGRTLQTERRR